MAKKKEEIEEKEEVIIPKEEKINVEHIKDDLTDYMKLKVEAEVSKAVEKSTKKLLRRKNSIIFKRNVTILVLLIICFFLGYNLCTLSNINIDITTTKKGEITDKKNLEESTKTEEKKEDPLVKLISEYGNLIDNIYINENSDYIEDFYGGNLSDELKLYLTLNNVDSDDIVSEDDTVYLEASNLESVYNNIFADDFVSKSFKYNDLSFHYLPSKEMFIASGKIQKVKPKIVRDIINIEVDDDLVIITTVEGVVKDDKLYNILSGEEVKGYNRKLSEYKDSLTEVAYYFEKTDDGFKLKSIKK